jgi:hypothetical protein
MASEEFDDAEGSYRRGYQQGAYDFLRAAEAQGFRPSETLRDWVNLVLAKWRFEERQGNRSHAPPDPPGYPRKSN